MTTEKFLTDLAAAWQPARDMGALGGASVEELRDHAAGFIPAAFRVHPPEQCLDVGTGVGLPGIFLAFALPNSEWTLVDASERRCEIANRAVVAVGLQDRVSVVHGRVDVLGRSETHRRCFDYVVSRLFGPMSETAECGLPHLRVGGSLVVSCAEEMVAVWQQENLAIVGGRYLGSWHTDRGVYVQIEGIQGLEDRFPRQPSARRRSPLFQS